MKISSSFDNNYIKNTPPSFGAVNLKKTHRKIIKRPSEKLPENPIILPDRIGEIAKWVGESVGMPEQKLFLAASAVFLQPAIDMKFAEEDKKSDVAIKSASKAIAGGITGVTIRILSERYFKKKIGHQKNGLRKYNKLNDYLLPTSAEKLYKENIIEYEQQLKRYCVTLGNICALFTMVFVTNEQIDVPLTGDFQDLFTGVARDGKTWEQSFTTVIKTRKTKIKRWFKRQVDYIHSLKDKTGRIFGIMAEDTSNIKPVKENTDPYKGITYAEAY